MSRINRVRRESKESPEFMFFCPGCECGHWFKTDGSGPKWTWNGDFEKPTIKPSILAVISDEDRCHSFVTDGKIRFLNDCTHDMKGQTVELPDWDNLG